MPGRWSCLTKRIVSVCLPQGLDAKQKIIVSYRYVSWLITSIYYLIALPYTGLRSKAVVVLALLIFSKLIMNLYLKSRAARDIQTIIIFETLGLSLLLIPTGGLESPFIWYAFNPVFIASYYLNAVYSWISIAFFLLTAFFVSSNLSNMKGLSKAEIMLNKSYILHVYILIIIAMRLLTRLVNQLDHQAEVLEKQRQEQIELNTRLHEANTNVKRSVEYVMSLYHIIEAFSTREKTRSIFQQMVESTINIMEGQAVFLCLNYEKDRPGDLMTQNFPLEEIREFQVFMDNEMTSLREQEDQLRLNYKEMNFEVIAVQTNSRNYGYLGLERKKIQNNEADHSKTELLKFLANLIVAILEREQLEKMSTKLMILAEQNRIADEMHDNVSQRLFSILCAVHTLNVNWRKIDDKSISNQLLLIEQSAQETSKELRVSIYQLSPSKSEANTFKETIDSYLREFSRLNNVTVTFEFHGDEESIPSEMKQAVYRIIREATGNAVRHGKCTEIQISMLVDLVTLELMLKDNGQGFDNVSALENPSKNGLGLKNMQTLAQTHGGTFNLSSRIGKGSNLQISIPL
ncbi:MAG: sensor histidine kinase [Desulfosporosinus sp.]|nr:sensor histidine kinase [Desulfosporosinus sp.]